MAYRKDDIPKVKLDFPKIDLSGVDFAIKNMNAIFDNIVKDIRERQDNAMAMEFTKCIGELLKKNGVVPKLTEYTRNFETDKTFETIYGVSIDELDFSEHDTVFENKIAELKKDYKTASELLGKYQQENEALKKRIIELENFSCQAEQETESLVEKLKQRIAELEDKIGDRDEIKIGDRDEIKRCLCERIAKLESKESEKTIRIEFHADNGEPFTPLEVANSLINQNTLEVDELRELAEHLQVYCRHHNDKEAETISF